MFLKYLFFQNTHFKIEKFFGKKVFLKHFQKRKLLMRFTTLVFFRKTLFSFVMQQKLAPGAELMVQGAGRSRALKGLTLHK